MGASSLLKVHTYVCLLYDKLYQVVYIAPMKALATEMTMNFAKRLAPLDLRVRELTGDTTLSRKEIAETQVEIFLYNLAK